MKKLYLNNHGLSIITAVIGLLVMSTIGSSLISVMTRSGKMVADEFISNQAFDVAQAGVQFAIKDLSTDSDWMDNYGTTYSMNFANGSFAVSYPNASSNSIDVLVVGTVNSISHSISQTLEKSSGSGYLSFDHAIYTEQDLTVSGQGELDVVGNVGVGEDVTASGQADVDITGDLSIDGDVYESGQADVAISGEDALEFVENTTPDPDWSYWEGIADTVIEGNYTLGSGQDSNTFTGIIYIKGNAKISGQSTVTVNGTVICEDKFSLAGQSYIHVTPDAGNPAIVAGGDVQLSGQGTGAFNLNGWIYSSTEVNISGQADLNMVGGLIAKEDVTITGQGDYDITYGAGVGGSGFTGGQAQTGTITVGRWEEVY